MPKPSMLEQVQKHSTALWHIHANPDGNAWCLSQSEKPPTREACVTGFMAIATYTPTHRDASGCWQHSVHWPTREEAEGKYDRLNRPATVSTDI